MNSSPRRDMMGIRTTMAAAAIAAMALVPAGTALAGGKADVTIKMSIADNQVSDDNVDGDVKSPLHACEKHVKVKLLDFNDKSVAHSTTAANGEFHINLENPHNDQFYRTKVSGNEQCKTAFSNPKFAG